jgi:hypothetical protein
MSGHLWVALNYQPIDVEEQPDGSLHTFTTEAGEEASKGDDALVCYICGAPLTTLSFHEVCPGELQPK